MSIDSDTSCNGYSLEHIEELDLQDMTLQEFAALWELASKCKFYLNGEEIEQNKLEYLISTTLETGQANFVTKPANPHLRNKYHYIILLGLLELGVEGITMEVL